MPFTNASATNGGMFIQQKGAESAFKVYFNKYFSHPKGGTLIYTADYFIQEMSTYLGVERTHNTAGEECGN